MIGGIINMLIGIWLTASADILGYQGAAADNDHIAGPIIGSIGMISISESVRNIRYLNVVSGLWLLAAPWLLHYDVALSTWNDRLAGVLLIGFSLLKGNVENDFGGGWTSLSSKNPEHLVAAKKM